VDHGRYLEWITVASLESVRRFDVATSDGRRFYGSLAAGAPRTLIVRETTGDVSLPAADVTVIAPIGAGGGFESNESLGLILRSQVAGTAGVRLVNSNRAQVSMSAGLAGNDEQNVDADATQNLEGILTFRTSYYAYDRPRTNFDFSIQYYPSLSNWGRQRLRSTPARAARSGTTSSSPSACSTRSTAGRPRPTPIATMSASSCRWVDLLEKHRKCRDTNDFPVLPSPVGTNSVDHRYPTESRTVWNTPN